MDCRSTPKFPAESTLTAIVELEYVDRSFKYFQPTWPRLGARPNATGIMPKTADAQPKTFETALEELETIVATMEGGQLPLAESLAAYKRGADLLQYCQAALKDAQQQVQVLEKGVLKA